jgi:hypothetical protein
MKKLLCQLEKTRPNSRQVLHLCRANMYIHPQLPTIFHNIFLVIFSYGIPNQFLAFRVNTQQIIICSNQHSKPVTLEERDYHVM